MLSLIKKKIAYIRIFFEVFVQLVGLKSEYWEVGVGGDEDGRMELSSRSR